MMRSNVWISLACCALFLASINRVRAAEGVTWMTSFADAQQEAKKTHKLVLIDFYADW